MSGFGCALLCKFCRCRKGLQVLLLLLLLVVPEAFVEVSVPVPVLVEVVGRAVAVREVV